MPLYDYLRAVEGLIRDRREILLSTEDLVSYINRSRRDIAQRTQCIRRMPPVSGAITSITITSPGHSYTAPTASVTPPDFPTGSLPFPGGQQATIANPQQIGGQISNIGVTYGGSGYFQPNVTISDPHGSGAAAITVMQPLMLLNASQEVYNFSDIPINTFPGVKEVYFILSATIIFNNFRYTMEERPFTYYQESIRLYPFQYEYVPIYYAQFGQGAGGSLYVYPVPNQIYQMELDCLCLPSDLETDQDFEAIPDPWTDAVPFYALHLAALELQNFNSARMYLELYRERTSLYSSSARPRMLTRRRW